MLDNIDIVLVGTTHPGNIGAAARAMKNMDLTRLTLVTPERFPSAEATSRASGADDLLSRARVCDSLDEALAECTLVMGTSARLRTIPWPAMEPRTAAEILWQGAQEGRVAVVFGREHSGLSNQELERCGHLIHIPTSEHFSSLNLGSAVQVMAYELKLAARESVAQLPTRDSPLALDFERQGLYAHMEEALVEIGFLNPDAPKQLMRRLKRLFNRVDLEQTEVNLLRGILKAAQRQARRPK